MLEKAMLENKVKPIHLYKKYVLEFLMEIGKHSSQL